MNPEYDKILEGQEHRIPRVGRNELDRLQADYDREIAAREQRIIQLEADRAESETHWKKWGYDTGYDLAKLTVLDFLAADDIDGLERWAKRVRDAAPVGG